MTEHPFRLFFKLARSLLLGVLLAAALMLFNWSRTGDPRFHRFLESDTGQRMAGFFQWYGAEGPAVPRERPETLMSPEERRVRQQLEEQVRADLPTHELVFTDGQTLVGRITEERSNEVVFVRTYGDSAEVTAVVPRRRLSRIRPIEPVDPGVTYRDVRFQMEFPELRFYRRPPFSLLTDESYFRVEETVDRLESLHGDFVSFCRDLIDDGQRAPQIQVLFFSRQLAFQEYQQKHAPHMKGTAGFYSPRLDRLVLFNQRASERVAELRRQLDAEVRRHRAESDSPAWQAHLWEWRGRMDQDIEQFAESQTRTTIRHEGAHQLFRDYGIHSRNGIEGDWLIEGLATYCEVSLIGAADPVRQRSLRRALEEGRLIGLEELISVRSESGLISFGLQEKIGLAYDQSWGLVHFLMQPAYQPMFFDYLRYLRDPGNFRDIRQSGDVALLCRFLNLEADELSRRWREYVLQMPP